MAVPVLLAIAVIGALILAAYAVQTPDAPPGQHAPALQEEERAGSDTTEADSIGEFRFEVVDTPETRAQGLSGRANVPAGYGMLFVFPEPGRYGFWMKDMRVPIDIIWLADDGTVLGVDEAVSPSTYPDSFYPPQDVRYVLETRAGEARAQGWDVGARVPLPESR